MRFMGAIIVIILIFINIFTVYRLLFNIIFGNADEFEKSVRYSLTPDIISLFRGEYWKDQVGEFKIGIFIITCIIATIVEYRVISGILQWIIGM